MRPYILAEANYGHIKHHQYDVAVLPCGATEPHNYHLPYGTDLFEGTVVGEKICQYAYERGGNVVLLPTVPYGTETNMHRFPLAMNVNPSTLFLFVTDLIHSCLRSGIKKILILNSHGGNDFKPLLRELADKIDGHLFLCSWYQSIGEDFGKIFEHKDDHGGEMETSFGLAYFPHLVAKNPDGTLTGDDGATQPSRFSGINQGWVSITRPWHLLTTNSGSGYPHAATAEKGHKCVDLVTQRVGQFLLELAQSPLDEKFPFVK